MARKTRTLRPDEKELWDKVAEQAVPLHAKPKNKAVEPPKKRILSTPLPSYSIEKFAIGQKSEATPPKHDLLPAIHDRLTAAPVRMDRKSFGKMKRGKLAPEGRIDLHGMTLDQAHPALTRFIIASATQGKRLVLVITGKGKDRDEAGPIPVPRGILKHQVPMWLSDGHLGPLILQIAPAHVSHGGSGAYYVYLRRGR